MTGFTRQSLDQLRALLSERPAHEMELRSLRRACVLIPLVETAPDEWSLIFTQRSESLPVHSGQISFPGGSVHEGESLIDGVLRETEEEIGVKRNHVELIGRLDDLETRSGFVVAPFVGILQERVDYVLQAGEVEHVFDAPLSVLMQPPNPTLRYLTYNGSRYPAYVFHHGPHEIWGLTGRILQSFLDIVRLTIPG